MEIWSSGEFWMMDSLSWMSKHTHVDKFPKWHLSLYKGITLQPQKRDITRISSGTYNYCLLGSSKDRSLLWVSIAMPVRAMKVVEFFEAFEYIVTWQANSYALNVECLLSATFRNQPNYSIGSTMYLLTLIQRNLLLVLTSDNHCIKSMVHNTDTSCVILCRVSSNQPMPLNSSQTSSQEVLFSDNLL